MFANLIDNFLSDVGVSAGYFGAEIWLSATIVAMLLLRLFSLDKFIPTSALAIAGAIGAGVSLYGQYNVLLDEASDASFVFFGGMLRQDLFSVFFRIFLDLFLLLTITLTVLTGIPDAEDAPDFYSLLFGATIGMMLMASANHLLILFLGIEMASVPSYVLVGFLKGRKDSSEAALKYVVYGAGAAGVMLYGISLVAGTLGTGDMGQLAANLSLVADGSGGLGDPEVRTVALGFMLILVGLAFKLSAVPFHFWCPDAFEGASAEVAGFLSVASKAGAFALLVRLCLSMSGGEATADLMVSFGVGLGVIAIVTTTYGNLTAYTQTNIKRLLAYSTIAHAGYMLMAVSAMMILVNTGAGSDGDIQKSIGGLLYYLAVYLFTNLAAFAVVALVRNQTYDESIDSFKGLLAHNTPLVVAMVICVFSLIGIPPFGGFLAKMMIAGSVVAAADLHWFMYVVLAFLGLNTVISLFYYARILKAMVWTERPEGIPEVRLPSIDSFYVTVLALMVACLGFLPYLVPGLTEVTHQAGNAILSVLSR